MPAHKLTPQTPTSDEVPVTRAMLNGVRTELIERIESVRTDLKGDVHSLQGDVHGIKGDIHGVKGDLHKLDAKIDAVRAELRSEIHDVKAGLARIEVLVEEQNARNKVVLDGITALLSRQNQVERRVDHIEETVRAIAAKSPAG